ncbi:MAG: prephenate dehydrogenase [Bacteroidales bacterium]|jgi:prephenate dehydrogenase|nr:prephenate dehydrogenase [Bacteroidales bacterium]
MTSNICIAGLGLIGGSLARSLRINGFNGKITGVDANPHHCTIAMYRGLADEFLPLDEAVEKSDIIILCAPVDANCCLLPGILDMIGGTGKVVTDMGSTKADISAVADRHPARGRYVAAHPMAGTEHSGPASALDRLFAGKIAIICDPEKSDDDALEKITALLQSLNMKIQYMNSREHDVHVAYVSHISHITSFALALCVLDKEKDATNIMSLAAGGFESTVRLSKSNAETWAPIFTGNSGPILEVIDTYIEKMRLFRKHIEKGDGEALRQLMRSANQIGNILK